MNAHIPFGRLTPPLLQTEHRSMQDHHAHNKSSHIEECTYAYDRLTLPPPPIEHRSMQHHYTSISFTYRRMHIYLK